MRSIRVILWAAAYGMLGVLSIASAQVGRGDVNGDGAMDGRDALLVLQHVRGKRTLTADELARADVSPLPGTGGRIIGDGEVNDGDAAKLLRYALGLVSRGEVTGQFEGPLITTFEPGAGGAGTRVTLRGLNFLANQPQENVVKLSGVLCRTLSASSTELSVEIPQGAASGSFTLITPGGTGVSQGRFLIVEGVSGQLSLPAQFPAEKTSVVSVAGEGTVGQGGSFTAPAHSGRATILGAIPQDKPKSAFLCYVFAGETQRSAPVIDAQSTAVALVMMQPFFATGNTALQAQFAAGLRALPEVAQLAAVIERVWVQSADPLHDAQFEAALQTAIEAAGNLAAALAPPPPTRTATTRAASSTTRAGEPGAALPRSFYNTDVAYLDLRSATDDNVMKKLFGGDIEARCELGSPVDWFVRIARLDTSNLTGLKELDKKGSDAVFRRMPYTATAIMSATRLVSTTELLGIGEPVRELLPKLLPLENTTDDALYVVRAFSGVLWGADLDDWATIQAMPLGEGDHFTAFLDNSILLILDTLAATLPVGKSLGVTLAIEPAVQKTISYVRQELGKYQTRASGRGYELTTDQLADLLRGAIAIFYDKLIEGLAKDASVKALLESCRDAVKKAYKPAQLLRQLLTWGSVAERAAGMMGLQTSSMFGFPPVTELETSFIIVGSPLAVKIQFCPDKVIPREQFEISVKTTLSASVLTSQSEVFFGTEKGRIVSVKALETPQYWYKLVVEAPTLPPGETYLKLKTPTGSATRGPLTVPRRPVITGVTPDRGFGAGTFMGQAYPGTKLTVRGSYFQPSADQVSFGQYGPKCAVLAAESTATTLTVRAPATSRSNEVYVRTEDWLDALSPAPFEVLGPPELVRISRNVAKGGSPLVLTGENFPYQPAAETESSVFAKFEYDGKVVYRPAVGTLRTTLTTTMAADVPEGTTALVKVVTPAGESSGIPVTRLKGREQGATFDVLDTSSTIAADGTISAGEALAWVQGKAIPGVFSAAYDDTNQDIVLSRQTIGGITQYTLVSSTPTAGSGGPGHETARIYYRGADGKDTYVDEIDLDSPETNPYGDVIPRAGVEEGDLVSSDHYGKDFADYIRVNTAGTLGDVKFDEPGSGGDQLQFSNVPGETRIGGDVVFQTDGNTIFSDKGGFFPISGKIAITGSYNTVNWLDAPGGVTIQGGSGNNLLLGTVGTTGTHIAQGIHLFGGSSENTIEATLVQNCDYGLAVSEASQRNNLRVRAINCGVGVRVMGTGTDENTISGAVGYDQKDAAQPCSTGVVISGGARFNECSAWVANSTGDGFVIRDAGTRGNKLNGVGALRNDGSGIHITEGAKENTLVAGRCEQNKAHGVLVDGKDTRDNYIGQYYINENWAVGVAIIGTAGGVLGNTVQVPYIYDNGGAGVLLQDLTGPDAATIKESGFINYKKQSLPHPAILLRNVSGVSLEKNKVTPDAANPYSAGMYFETASSVVSNSDRVENCDKAVHLTGGDKNVFEGLATARNGQGVVIEGATTNTEIRRAALADRGDSLLISGTAAAGNSLVGSQLTNVVVQGGARDTTIGSELPNLGNTITSDQTPGIAIRGAATSGVVVYGNTVNAGTAGGILVEGAGGAQIGSAVGSGGNKVTASGAFGVRLLGTKSAQLWANTIWCDQTGVDVTGECNKVEIGSPAPGHGNTIGGRSNAAVRVSGPDAQGVVIAGNTLGGVPQMAIVSRRGVLLEDGARGVSIASNTVQFNTGDGIAIAGADNTLLRDNTISGNAGNGILISIGGAQNVMRGNTITKNGGYGVVLGTGVDQNCVTGGSIALNTAGGIHAGQPAVPTTHVGGDAVYGEVPSGVPSGSIVQVYADLGEQGERYLGQARATGGAWRVPVAVPEGMNATATVTDPQGNTSAFGLPGAPTIRPAFYGNQMLLFGSSRDGNGEIYRRLPGDLADTRLTSDPAADHSPALAPGGAAIAWVSERSGDPDVWAMAADGSNPTRLTNHAAPDYDPVWSPDGKKLAFVSERDGNPEVYVMNADGSGVARLTNAPGVDRQPAWSPDGSKIAFTSDRGGNADIWVMNADGSGAAALPGSPQADYDPAWSPDGARLAFVSERDGNPDVYLMGADGSAPTRLTSDPGADREPAWSPDGAWVAYSSAQAGDAEIFARQVASGRLERLTVSLGVNVQPAWGGPGVVTRLTRLGR